MAFINQITPRNIPTGLLLRIKFLNSGVSLGLVFISSLIFLPFMLQNKVDDEKEAKYKAYGAEADGIITEATKTNRTANHQRIYSFKYDFTVNNEVIHGACEAVNSKDYEKGSKVSIVYLPNETKTNRIRGLYSGKLPDWIILIFLFFPAIGILIVFKGIKQGSKNVALVVNGVVAKAKLIGKERVYGKKNSKPRYKLQFEYKTKNGEIHRTNVVTSSPDKFTDESEETLVYNELSASEAVLIDDLPSAVKKYFI